MKNKEEFFEVFFEKIVPEGKALGRREDGKVVFCFGVLPQERALVSPIYEKKSYVLVEPVKIIEPSPLRQPPREEHFLSCSPWQIIPYKEQLKLKRQILKEVYFQVLKQDVNIDEFVNSKEVFGYRTKMEFSFVGTEKGVSLAFHKRGTWFKKIPVQGCLLASQKMNKAVNSLVKEINRLGISIAHLKSVVVRESKSEDERLIVLYVPEERFDTRFLEIDNLEETDGFLIVYSRAQSPASVVDQVLKVERKDFLTEKVLGKELRYYFDSFFQNNIKVFEEAIRKMQDWVGQEDRVLELYGGVGSISIGIGKGKEIKMIELDENMVQLAQENASRNGVNNFRAFALPDRKIDFAWLKETDALILDPPRAGLHKKVIQGILRYPPSRILYLSCNPITQARDFSYLQDIYEIKALYGFDFYPNTPHLESLLILERKS